MALGCYKLGAWSMKDSSMYQTGRVKQNNTTCSIMVIGALSRVFWSSLTLGKCLCSKHNDMVW